MSKKEINSSMIWEAGKKDLATILLLGCFLGHATCRDAVSVFGVFQNTSILSSFKKVLADVNATQSIFTTDLHSSHGLANLVNRSEEVRERMRQSGAKKKILFTDTYGIRSEIVKEILLEGGQSIDYDDSLNGHQQAYLQAAAGMLSFLDTLDFPSRRISVFVDDTEFGKATLTQLLIAVQHSQRKIVSFATVKEPFKKENLTPFILKGSGVFLVDSEGGIAGKLFYIAQQLGLGGLRNSITWILSKRTMDSLSLTCSFPQGIYYGLQTRGAVPNEKYIAQKVTACKEQLSNGEDCPKREQLTTAYQLWSNPNVSSGSAWSRVTQFDLEMSNVIVHKHGRNPFWPRLRVSVVENSPWTIITKYRKISSSESPCSLGGRLGIRLALNSSELICLHGFTIDIIKELENRLQFVAIIHLSKDGKYGSFDESKGMIDGIVGELARGEADFGVELIEDKTRNQFISYTSPHTITSISMAYLQRYDYKEADIFEPFSVELWLCILGTICLLVVVIWILERVSPYSQFQLNKRILNAAKTFDIDDSANYIMGTFFTGEIIDQKPRTIGSRSTNIVVAFVSILIISAYSANLIKFLVVLDEEPIVTGLKDQKLLSDSSQLKVGIEDSSFLPNYLRTNSDARIRKLYSTRVIGYASFAESIKALKNRSVDIVLYDYLSLVYTQSVDRDCSLKILQLSNAIMGIPISLNNQSTWKGRLNAAAVDLTLSGTADNLLKTWFSQQLCKNSNIFYSLDIRRMATLFFWLSVGILCCIVCMTGIILLKKLKEFFTGNI